MAKLSHGYFSRTGISNGTTRTRSAQPPPRDPEQPIIKRSDFERIALESGVISASALSAYGYGLVKYGQKPQASTILFMSLTLGQILHTISCRSETHSIFDRDRLPDNHYVDGAVIGSAALQLLPIFIPGLGNIMQLAPLDPLDWLVIASTAGLPLMVNETTKNSRGKRRLSPTDK